MQRAMHRNTGSSSNENPLGPMEASLSYLWVSTPFVATVSVVVVLVAMLTNQWLHTEEKMHNPSYNGTGERDYLSKMTVSGLWMICFTNRTNECNCIEKSCKCCSFGYDNNTGETIYQCSKMDYFSKEEYSPDLNDSTMAIPYTVTKTVLFFIVASLLLFSGYCCCIFGQCVRHRTLYTFVSGVVFIITGLVMLFGLIMYISIFKSEIGSKLRPKSQLQPAMFVYSYGYSFMLYIFGLITTQISGILTIFLFIRKTQYEWARKHLEDLKKGKRPQTNLNYNHYDATLLYPCRRHPQAYVNHNSAIHFPPSPVHQKRYYFSKEPMQGSPCSIHRPMRSHSNSLKDVSTYYDFPPPPTISYQFEEHFNRDYLRNFPRDVTTNTVSTTADVNCDDFLSEPFDDYSPSVQHEHEFVTFDLDQPLPIRAQSIVSINSRNGTLRKGYDSDTLRRTTPV